MITKKTYEHPGKGFIGTYEVYSHKIMRGEKYVIRKVDNEGTVSYSYDYDQFFNRSEGLAELREQLEHHIIRENKLKRILR